MEKIYNEMNIKISKSSVKYNTIKNLNKNITISGINIKTFSFICGLFLNNIRPYG
ncbi:hypothetical protein AOR01nite_22320 [Acetobacter orleanensis]|uniref:Uncharacterized protein n=1 Tax=Acetobacter orleanensis TaxID=104099 RepID=A0A4Y3TSM3_9PROT|nr:hypothetical protein Abol_027_020 [Acetobacter orleanensis JCM 7639]GEB83755.1 hypothetical protein AOR01nite_22320 [Acetobacter orleanensis]